MKFYKLIKFRTYEVLHTVFQNKITYLLYVKKVYDVHKFIIYQKFVDEPFSICNVKYNTEKKNITTLHLNMDYLLNLTD